MQNYKEANMQNTEWIEIPKTPKFKSKEEVYAIVKHLPLYGRKNKEEVFLGIKKSKSKGWGGWQYIACIRKEPNFSQLLIDLGIYELALNYLIFQDAIGHELKLDELLRNYDFL